MFIVSRAEGMSFGQAVYFVIITALTIGYGDITPETTWGRVASVAAGIIGMMTTGIIIAVAVRSFGQAIQEAHEDHSAKND